MDENRHVLAVNIQDSEHICLPDGGRFVLLADASDTGGALGANRLTLARGATGASTHHHVRSTELFYVLDGAAWFTAEGTTTTVETGGLFCVPPGVPHAFGAAPGSTADLLVVLTPGVDRFDYFRALGRIRAGEESFDQLLPQQERFDVHFHL
ncbi:cupin domain-containing protein [Streptomyces sp. NPDC004111]|uniref:cupin domain-containing protein n=1 Tax=Streptomyces sp. NPDC004111 TaxID=3364690 RepID=UPI003682FAE1